jgi:lipopolysaccharide transport protein LptA
MNNFIVVILILISKPILAEIIDDIDELDKQTESINVDKTDNIIKKEIEKNPVAPKKETPKPASSKKPNKVIKTTPADNSKQPVKFTSVGLTASGNNGNLKLKKDVRVTQGRLNLFSDEAEIYLEDETREVEKVMVEGNVSINNNAEIQSESIKAKSDSAIFYASDQLIILKGNARLWRGSDLMRGKIIRYQLKTGWIEVEQVQGVMKQSEDNQVENE